MEARHHAVSRRLWPGHRLASASRKRRAPRRVSLRAKSVLALSLAFLLVLAPTFLFSWLAVNHVRAYFGQDFASNVTLLNRETLLASTLVDLALVRTLADSAEAQAWLLDETQPRLQQHFFDEAEDYRMRMQDRVYFIASALTSNYYFVDETGHAAAPRRLRSSDPQDAWLLAMLEANAPYTVNVAHDPVTRRIGVWINIPIIDNDTVLGVLGTYHDLTDTLATLAKSARVGLTPMVIDRRPTVETHTQFEHYVGGQSELLLAATPRPLWANTPPSDHPVLEQALAAARRTPFELQQARVTLSGTQQHLSIAYAEAIDWYVITALNPTHIRFVAPHILWLLAAATLLLILLLLGGVGLAVERVILRPLRRLQGSTAAVAEGEYNLQLPDRSNDEIGDLTQAFSIMATQVRDHTAELEHRVQARTAALEQANTAMAATQQKIQASLDYAALLQRSILPEHELARSLGERHFLFWRPRDTVGGDFYIFQRGEHDYLVGVLDCAGHGVPGALMTMLMHVIVNLAIQECGRDDPAALLAKCNGYLHGMLDDKNLPRTLAVNTDAAFLHVDPDARVVRYAGAAMGLYAANGDTVEHHRGSRRALGSHRDVPFHNVELPLAGQRLYLTSDGWLDQAGGEDGYGFGETRFVAMLRDHAGQSMPHQAVAFAQELASWQGRYPQRDDITLLGLHVERP